MTFTIHHSSVNVGIISVIATSPLIEISYQQWPRLEVLPRTIGPTMQSVLVPKGRGAIPNGKPVLGRRKRIPPYCRQSTNCPDADKYPGCVYAHCVTTDLPIIVKFTV